MTVQKNAIGVAIRLTVLEDNAALDISGATTKNVIIKSPAGTVKTFAGAFVTDGTDGKVEYITVATSDLDSHGIWQAQAELDMFGYTGRTSRVNFVVDANL